MGRTSPIPPLHFGDLIRLLSDREKVLDLICRHKTEAKGYLAVVSFVLLVFGVLSDKTFSFLITIASIISTTSFMLIAVAIEYSGSCEGLSVRMMECWVVIGICRMVAVLPFEGYLPYDATGDWFYQVSEVITFLLICCILFSCKMRYDHTASNANDLFPHRYLVMIAGCASCVAHPTLNDYLPSDIAYAFALYLEAVSSLPQLYIFQREQKILPWTAHFLAAQAAARCSSLLFWFASFSELHDEAPLEPHPETGEFVHPELQVFHERYYSHPFSNVPGHTTLRSCMGYWVLLVQCFQLLLMADFALQYGKCIQTGEAVAISSCADTII